MLSLLALVLWTQDLIVFVVVVVVVFTGVVETRNALRKGGVSVKTFRAPRRSESGKGGRMCNRVYCIHVPGNDPITLLSGPFPF